MVFGRNNYYDDHIMKQDKKTVFILLNDFYKVILKI